ncbi:MAG: Rrf2 family transcriptional regulator [Pyrinomonadaceae bacterium]|nr:Rrf2 family transcriptional regulator [Pyrinomonadaceae bacterium]
MLLSKTTGYGIRALVYIAQQGVSQLCGLQEIAAEENIPPAYLGKVLGDLRKHQLLRSVKGLHGGYELAQPADKITLWDVYQILDPLIDCNQCILGLTHCEERNPCALHDSWIPIKDEFVEMLRTKTIAQISNGN